MFNNFLIYQNLNKFLKQFVHPIEELASKLSPFNTLLSQAALSATKILERAEGQAEYQMQNLMISQEGLQTPDEIYNNNSGVRDTLVPFQLAKWAFLTFLVAGICCPVGQYTSCNKTRHAMGFEKQG